MATPSVLVNTVTISQGGGSVVVRSGEVISDAAVQTAVAGAGGTLVPTGNSVVDTATAIVQKLRARGANEDECDKVMIAALAFASF